MSASTISANVLRDESLLRDSAYVDGTWVSRGESGRFSVGNPSTDEQIADLPSLSRVQVAAAIDAAGRALRGWRAWSGKQRAQVLRRWFDLVTEHAEDLACLITLEEGKPLAEAHAVRWPMRPRSSSGSPRKPSGCAATSSPHPIRPGASSC